MCNNTLMYTPIFVRKPDLGALWECHVGALGRSRDAQGDAAEQAELGLLAPRAACLATRRGVSDSASRARRCPRCALWRPRPAGEPKQPPHGRCKGSDHQRIRGILVCKRRRRLSLQRTSPVFTSVKAREKQPLQGTVRPMHRPPPHTHTPPTPPHIADELWRRLPGRDLQLLHLRCQRERQPDTRRRRAQGRGANATAARDPLR